jgi:sulfate permease, SulP family
MRTSLPSAGMPNNRSGQSNRPPVVDSDMPSGTVDRDKARTEGVRPTTGEDGAANVAQWAAPPATGLSKYLPILGWIGNYQWSKWLIGDVIAGLALWGILVPEGMGYAGIAGMPVQAGLYTLVGSLILYAIFGTSRQLVVGATAAASSITASVVASQNAANANEYGEMLAVVVLAVGALFVLGGLLRLGFIAAFIPRPVMAGFVFGLGLFIMTKQIYKVFGLPKPSGSTIQLLATDISNLDKIDWTTAAFGVGAIVTLLAFERFLPKVPGVLVVLLGGIGLSAALNLGKYGVDIVGKVPGGLPDVAIPSLSPGELASLVAGAVGVMLVIMSEGLGAADNFAQKHHYRVDTNQELFATGIANLGSSFLGGLASGGGMSGSSVNDTAGAKTTVSLVAAWVMVILTLLFLTPVFTNLPEAVLGAIVIVAVKGLIKVDEFKEFWKIHRAEFWLGAITLGAVVVWDVLPAMILGVTLAILTITYQASRSSVAVLARKPGTRDAWRALSHHRNWETVPGILVLRGNAQLFYANADATLDEAKRLIGEARPQAVVFDAESTRALDITGAEVFVRLVKSLHEAGIHVAIAAAAQAGIEFAERGGLLEAIGRDNVYLTIDEAVESLKSAIRTRSQRSNWSK